MSEEVMHSKVLDKWFGNLVYVLIMGNISAMTKHNFKEARGNKPSRFIYLAVAVRQRIRCPYP